MSIKATYSPDDNKLRLYPNRLSTGETERLDPAIYQRIHSLGFIWAPQQQLFVAPKWTPEREDLLLQLCGDIVDDDTTLEERAEIRAERFDGYSEKRKDEAESARNALQDRIPAASQIIIGHNSRARAEREAEKLKAAMTKAVSLWETSEYWTRRAKRVLRHADYKKRDDVRYRRIKDIEADKRKEERAIAHAEKRLKLWQSANLTREKALFICNYLDHTSRCFSLADYPRDPPASQYEGPKTLWGALNDGIITEVQARDIAVPAAQATIRSAQRWITHYNNRLAYERALLDESGDMVATQVEAKALNIAVGGQVLISNEWLTVIRVNKRDGKVVSIRTNARFAPIRGIEEVKAYKEPTQELVEKVKKATKQAPLCNYPGEGFRQMTSAEYEKIGKGARFIERIKATATHAAHRVRHVLNSGSTYRGANVFITDVKRVDPPALTPDSAPVVIERVRVGYSVPSAAPVASVAACASNPFKELKAQLETGIKVVASPELFASTPVVIDHILNEAAISPGQRILEPSAGTGAILREIRARYNNVHLTAVEINSQFTHLSDMVDRVIYADFLQCTSLGDFDRIVMNPPFSQEVKHVMHALSMLKPGGKLVAVMSAGINYRENAGYSELRSLIRRRGDIQQLPKDAFKASGTGVQTALVVIG